MELVKPFTVVRHWVIDTRRYFLVFTSLLECDSSILQNFDCG